MKAYRQLGVASVALAGMVAALLASAGGAGDAPSPAAGGPVVGTAAETRPVIVANGSVYALDHRVETRLVVRAAGRSRTINGQLHLAGRWHVAPRLGARGERLVEVRLSALSRHEMRMLGRSLLEDAEMVAAFESQRALVTLDDEGRAVRVHYNPAAPALYQHVMTALVLDALPTDRSRRAHLRTGLGEGRFEVTATGDATSARREVHRSLTGYASLDALGATVPQHGSATGATRLVFEDAGMASRLDANETVRVGERFEATRKTSLVRVARESVPAAPRPDLAQLAVREPGRTAVTSQTRRQMLEQRVAGLKLEQLLDDLSAVGADGRVADHARWLWRATGVLRLDPKAAARLAQRYLAPEMTAPARGLIVDLLASVGDAQAQHALLMVLRSDVAQAAPEFATQLQRLGALRQPTPETAGFVRRLATASDDPEIAAAATVTLGAVAGRLRARGETAAAAALAKPLLARLEAGADASAIVALGNAALPATEATITAHGEDADPAIRASVARALRDIPTTSARDSLLALGADADYAVQHRALGVLASRDLGADGLDRFVGVLEAGSITPNAFGRALAILERHTTHPEVVQRGIDHIRSRLGARRGLLPRVNALQASLDRAATSGS